MEKLRVIERLKKGMRQKMDLGNKFYDFFSHIQNIFGGPQNPPPAFLSDYFRSGYRHYFNYCRGIHRSGSAEFDFRTGCGTWFKYDCRNSRTSTERTDRHSFYFFGFLKGKGFSKFVQKRKRSLCFLYYAGGVWSSTTCISGRNLSKHDVRRRQCGYKQYYRQDI